MFGGKDKPKPQDLGPNPGKIAVQSLCECKDRDALSTAYTPGVAEPCRKIKANPDDVYTYTMKGRTVAVVTKPLTVDTFKPKPRTF